MLRFALSRLLQGILALLFLSVLIFAMSRLTGDVRALILPDGATEEDYIRIGQSLGLDRPLPAQYGVFLVNTLMGDLGTSLYSGEEVSALLLERGLSSARLGLAAIIIVLVLGIPSGVLAGAHRGTVVDSAVKFVSLLGMSVPPFWAGIVFIQVFAVWLGWLPAGTDRAPTAIILPAFTLALTGTAGVARLLRSAMLDVLDSEYVKLARSKGVSEAGILWKHALKNALLPVIGFTGILFVLMLTLAMSVEVVFAWPGLGQLTFTAVITRDYPVIQGVVLLAGAVAIFVGLIADILYAYIDPRIHYESRSSSQ